MMLVSPRAEMLLALLLLAAAAAAAAASTAAKTITAFLATRHHTNTKRRRRRQQHHPSFLHPRGHDGQRVPSSSSRLASSAVAVEAPSTAVASSTTRKLSDELTMTLKKPSKTMAVVFDVDISSESEKLLLSESEISTLSMQLRKLKASAICTSDVQVAKILVDEQATAIGNFPGPCPVIYTGNNNNNAEEKVLTGAGVSAMVVSPNDDDALADADIDIIYRVNNLDDVTAAVSKGSNGFLVDSAQDIDLDSIMDAIPTGSVIIAGVESMQPQNNEISVAKQFKDRYGVTSIIMTKSIVGDGEDLEYTSYIIDGLTKKKSSTFNMSGLTGSTNGHFGGVASSSQTEKTWIRAQRQQQEEEQ